MKVLIAMDSFKESLSSLECGKAICEGIREVYKEAEIVAVPIADGGEGTIEALVHAAEGEWVEKEVIGPLGTPIQAQYGILGQNHAAVIEVSAACGLPLVPKNNRNPYVTTTYGVGQLICDAIDKGCREFVIGLGGSATNDAGIGMLQALGYSFKDGNNKEVGFGGHVLQQIQTIDTSNAHPLLKTCTFKIACDVNNPLYGENGAAYVYGPQKGATPEMVEVLDSGLKQFATILHRECKIHIHDVPGAGAAGGLGAAFIGFLHAQLYSGVDIIMDMIGIEQKMQDADLVITGEGRLDGQTSRGKAPLGVAKIAEKHGVPVIALAGAATQQASILNEMGVTSYFSILNEPMLVEEAMDARITFENLRSTTIQLFKLIAAMKE
ncbi:glycerate kinase [Bacillus sp. FJAT-50079]|uniref:glycerate kinase n=1 Tax=Bacillus sp. FJAT-50079 TaxID=2833577 RepID=UPI001BCA0447|nr:glycerate kinase [Bacillus sp. FJAT-50079]MBS4208522.1 glycerate kinase [Bacillus sp. FJAT-50079]